MCAVGDVNVFSLIRRDDLPMESSCGRTFLSQNSTLRKTSCLVSVKRDGALTVLSLH